MERSHEGIKAFTGFCPELSIECESQLFVPLEDYPLATALLPKHSVSASIYDKTRTRKEIELGEPLALTLSPVQHSETDC